MATFKDHFSTHASGYAAYRPTYPSALVDFLADITPEPRTALDVGCGTGQLSVPLTSRFDRVVATDASAAQIQNAEPHSRVEYRAAPAEESGLPDASVDLVTVAQAAHWLELEPFYREVRRVARPRGAIALISYDSPVVDDPAVQALVSKFYHETIGPYWPPERRLVETRYRTLPFPFREIEAPTLAIVAEWDLGQLLGYVDTWSAVRQAEKAVGRAPIEDFRSELAAGYGPTGTRRRVTWPIALRVGHVAR